MTVELPETTKVLGTRSVWVVPTATIPDLDTITVANLAAGFKATCYIYGNGGTVTGEQQRGDAPRKLCEVTVRQNIGTVTQSISDIQYSYKPQGDAADEANDMKEAMLFGTTVVIVDRLGVADETAPAAGQLVNAYRVTLGYQNRTQTGDDDQAEYSITQGASLDATQYDVELT
jgi:hypothetical protein